MWKLKFKNKYFSTHVSQVLENQFELHTLSYERTNYFKTIFHKHPRGIDHTSPSFASKSNHINDLK
jgi:hypothetical protein